MTKEDKRKKKLEYNKRYYLKNRDVFLEQKRQYRELNRETLRKKQELYRNQNRDIVNARKMKSYYKYRDEICERRRKNYELNWEEMIEKNRRYVELNREKIRKQQRKKYKTDLNSRIARVLRARIREALQNNSKSDRTEKLLGSTISELVISLESRFKQGMTWQNYGEWEIDHIRPLSSFDLTNSKEQQKAFHYTNLQPLWMKENRQKWANILN